MNKNINIIELASELAYRDLLDNSAFTGYSEEELHVNNDIEDEYLEECQEFLNLRYDYYFDIILEI